MHKLKPVLLALGLLISPLSQADVQVGISMPGVSLGINLPTYPYLVPVPGYPVYFAPQLQANFFFYDGYYWIYQYDTWYSSSWYNGPWWPVNPDQVPLYILRVPVQYYMRPPSYFIGWQPYAPPHWGERFGREWEMQRRGWDRWDRRNTPAPAPLPSYQRQYPGDRYPQQWQQQQLQQQHYRYRPHDPEVQQRAAPQAPGQRDNRQPGTQYQPMPVPQRPPGGMQPNTQYRQNAMPIPQRPPEGNRQRDHEREQPRGQEQHRND